MFQSNFEEQIIIQISVSTDIPPPGKSCRLLDNVDKYGGSLKATDDNIIRRMRFCMLDK